MSTSYWVIEGVGIPLSKVLPHIVLDKFIAGVEKCSHKTKKEIEVLREAIVTNYHASVEEFVTESEDDYLARVITAGALIFGDEFHSLCYTIDNEDDGYLYYPPSMPWERKENEPTSIEEVHDRIVKAVQSVTDMNEADILACIDDEIFIVCEG